MSYGPPAQPKTTTSTLTKTDFMKTCELIIKNGGGMPSDIGLAVKYSGNTLEQREETITVAAGTFETNYVKSNVTINMTGTSASAGNFQQESDGIAEVWSIGHDYL